MRLPHFVTQTSQKRYDECRKRIREWTVRERRGTSPGLFSMPTCIRKHCIRVRKRNLRFEGRNMRDDDCTVGHTMMRSFLLKITSCIVTSFPQEPQKSLLHYFSARIIINTYLKKNYVTSYTYINIYIFNLFYYSNSLCKVVFTVFIIN